jgi:hypothetical protein
LLATFFELHAERSLAANLPPHANVFTRQPARDFLLEYAQRMAERYQLRIFQLVIGGEVVATRVGFVLGNELYLYYSGYRVAWAQHSVMTTVVAESIKWAIQTGTGRCRSVDRPGPVEAAVETDGDRDLRRRTVLVTAPATAGRRGVSSRRRARNAQFGPWKDFELSAPGQALNRASDFRAVQSASGSRPSAVPRADSTTQPQNVRSTAPPDRLRRTLGPWPPRSRWSRDNAC